jgi:predicted RNA-binding Zn ribbon-like protein
MPIWDRLRQELDRAGRTAADAVDEGRLRLDLYRARQNADRSAQKLGYALFRARTAGTEINSDEYTALANDLRVAEAEVTRYDTLVNEVSRKRKGGDDTPSTPPSPPSAAPPSETPPAQP